VKVNPDSEMVGAEVGSEVAVSVVVPSFNEEAHIRHCLLSLSHQQTARPYEVIIVDSSTDATPQIIRREFPTVRLIRCDQRTFPAQARNIGIQQARGPLIAFLDADCIANPLWIDAIICAHQKDNLAIGGSIALAPSFSLAGAVLFAIEFSEFTPGSPPRQIRWLPSCNLSVKREALEKYGAFPTHLEASEDILFTRNLKVQSKTALWVDSRIKIAHTNRNSFADFRQRLKKLGYWSGRSRGSGIIPGGVLLRHPILIPLLVPYRFIVILLRLLFRSTDTRLFFLCLLCWPLLLYGLIIWAQAFWHGVHQIQPPAQLTSE